MEVNSPCFVAIPGRLDGYGLARMLVTGVYDEGGFCISAKTFWVSLLPAA
jgi:hypothetical protein